MAFMYIYIYSTLIYTPESQKVNNVLFNMRKMTFLLSFRCYFYG